MDRKVKFNISSSPSVYFEFCSTKIKENLKLRISESLAYIAFLLNFDNILLKIDNLLATQIKK